MKKRIRLKKKKNIKWTLIILVLLITFIISLASKQIRKSAQIYIEAKTKEIAKASIGYIVIGAGIIMLASQVATETREKIEAGGRNIGTILGLSKKTALTQEDAKRYHVTVSQGA